VCNEGDFTEILLRVGQGLDEEKRHLMITVARLLWLRRNKFIFEGVLQGPAVMVRIAREQMEAFDSATHRHTDPSSRSNAREEAIWKKPP
jgi:hypothetical protein